MKTLKGLFSITPLALLIAGCAAPVSHDTPYAEWRSEELLPPTGIEPSHVYSQPETYPAIEPNIIVQTDRQRAAAGDLSLADAIREKVEYDRGLAPSLRHVTIEVRDGGVIVRGVVRSDLDSRVIVDDLKDMTGVTRITNNLEIDPDIN